MGNRLYIESIKFDHGDSVEFGVKAFDDFAQSYDDTWDDLPGNDLDVLKRLWVNGSNPIINDMIDFINEMSHGCYINDEWYGWDQIKHIFEMKKTELE